MVDEMYLYNSNMPYCSYA